MRYTHYMIVKPSGNIEKLKVPSIWNAFEVTKKLTHDDVFMKVPKNRQVRTENAGRVFGIAWVYVMKNGKFYRVTGPPTEERSSLDLLGEIGL